MTSFEIFELGDHALVASAVNAVSFETQQRIWQIGDRARGWPEVEEAIPGMNNITLVFDPLATDIDALRLKLERACMPLGTEPSGDENSSHDSAAQPFENPQGEAERRTKDASGRVGGRASDAGPDAGGEDEADGARQRQEVLAEIAETAADATSRRRRVPPRAATLVATEGTTTVTTTDATAGTTTATTTDSTASATAATAASHTGVAAAAHRQSSPIRGRLVELAVHYGGTNGPDIEAVAQHTGLSVEALIERHAAGEYTVYFLGFQPGFAYLGGLDPALATPRRREPRLSVPAGSVGIGGEQTGVYPTVSPGGWQLIGRTSAVLFDPNRDPPSLLEPGDRVRFVPVGGTP